MTRPDLIPTDVATLDPAIIFIMVVPDGDPLQATPLQGFAPSLARFERLIRLAILSPTTVHDWSEEGRRTLVGRRVCGAFPIQWYPQSPRAVRAGTPPVHAPFVFYLLPPGEHVSDYDAWRDRCPLRPVLVAEEGGDLRFDDIAQEAGLIRHLLSVLDRLPTNVDPVAVTEFRSILGSPVSSIRRELGYRVGGHNSVRPNVAVLSLAGYQEIVKGPFDDTKRGIGPYVDQIVRTAHSILDLRRNEGDVDMGRIFLPPADVNLFAPSIFPHVHAAKAKPDLGVRERRAFDVVRRALERQNGYAFELGSEERFQTIVGAGSAEIANGAHPSPHPLVGIRSMELNLSTTLVEAMAASNFSCVLRMPNAVNRTAGAVRNFAAGHRGNSPLGKKRLRGFREVQAVLASSVPKPFLDVIRRSETGVRIVADAHLEWLNVDGLPLMLAKTCTRVPVTPGNLFVEQTTAKNLVHLEPGDFDEILVLDAMASDDPLAGMLESACRGYEKGWEGRTRLKVVPVSSLDALVEALNAYDGPLVVFDGHGIHEPGRPAKLKLGHVTTDIWGIRERLIRTPPIFVLSACDTHAADRNHATTGNGFLSLGARTVLASVFPLDGRDAAIFAARLLNRVALYLRPAIQGFEEGLRWSDVVTGMLRMQAANDFLYLLMRRQRVDQPTYEKLCLISNMIMNDRAPAPFGRLLATLEQHGLERKELDASLELAIANSNVIGYLQLGRPETILIDMEERRVEQIDGFSDRDEGIGRA